MEKVFVTPANRNGEQVGQRVHPALHRLSTQEINQEIEREIKSHKDVESTWLHDMHEDTKEKNHRAKTMEFETPGKLTTIVNSQLFNILTTAMICINGLVIGIETDYGDGSLSWTVLEYIFFAFYTIELLVRFGAGGMKILKEDGWIRFDTFVMTMAFIDVLIISPMQQKQGDTGGQAKQIAMVLRITRLMKLMRIIRLLRFLKELWLLCRSFVSAFKTLVWTFVLLILVVYLFAIVFVRVLGDEHAGSEGNAEIYEWFGTMPRAMFTLFQIVTLEAWSEIAREVWKCEQWYMVYVILLFIMITTLAIMNTVTAVIVEHTMSEAVDQTDDLMRRAQQELHNNASALVSIFCAADDNHNGMLSKDEFVEAIKSPHTRKCLQEMGLGEDVSCLEADEIALMFETIDIDDSGELSPQEFVKGMMQMRGSARARSLFELDCRVQKMHHMNRQYYDKVIVDFQDQVSGFLKQADEESRQTQDALRALEMRESRMEMCQTRMECQLAAISARLGVAPIAHGDAPHRSSQSDAVAPINPGTQMQSLQPIQPVRSSYFSQSSHSDAATPAYSEPEITKPRVRHGDRDERAGCDPLISSQSSLASNLNKPSTLQQWLMTPKEKPTEEII